MRSIESHGRTVSGSVSWVAVRATLRGTGPHSSWKGPWGQGKDWRSAALGGWGGGGLPDGLIKSLERGPTITKWCVLRIGQLLSRRCWVVQKYDLWILVTAAGDRSAAVNPALQMGKQAQRG